MQLISLSLLYDKTSYRETVHTSLFTPDREHMIDKLTDSTKVQFDEPMSFTRVIYRTVGERLLIGIEMISRQLNHQGHPSTGDISHGLEPDAHCTNYS